MKRTATELIEIRKFAEKMLETSQEIDFWEEYNELTDLHFDDGEVWAYDITVDPTTLTVNTDTSEGIRII